MSQRKYRIHIVGPEAYEEMVEAARSLDESLPSHGVALVEDATERTGFVFPMYPDDTKEEEIKAWEPIVQAALSAAEKEREGGAAIVAKCSTLGCDYWADIAFLLDGEWHPYCPHCRKAVSNEHPDARHRPFPISEPHRDGDVIEKLREAILELPHELRWTARTLVVNPDTLAGHEVPEEPREWVLRSDVLALLDSLSSEEGR